MYLKENGPTFPYRMMKPLDLCYFAIHILAVILIRSVTHLDNSLRALNNVKRFIRT